MALARTVVFNSDSGGAADVSGGSSITKTSIALSTGDLLVVKTSSSDAFSADQVTGITWNGISLTNISSFKGAAGSGPWFEVSAWYLKVASGATGDLVISYAGNVTTGRISVVKYTGHDTTTPIGDIDTGETESATPSLTLTTVPGDYAENVFVIENYGNPDDVGAGETADFYAGGLGASYKAASGTTTTVAITKFVGNTNKALQLGFVVQQSSGGGAGDFIIYNPKPLRGPVLAQ